MTCEDSVINLSVVQYALGETGLPCQQGLGIGRVGYPWTLGAIHHGPQKNMPTVPVLYKNHHCKRTDGTEELYEPVPVKLRKGLQDARETKMR